MKRKQWTKDEIKTVVNLWSSMTTTEIGKELGRTNTQVSSMAMNMRKVGFKLPKKHRSGYIRNLLQEVLKETR